MGKITGLQNDIKVLQASLATKNKIIAAENARDTKIRAELEKTKAFDFSDHAKLVEEIKKLMG